MGLFSGVSCPEGQSSETLPTVAALLMFKPLLFKPIRLIRREVQVSVYRLIRVKPAIRPPMFRIKSSTSKVRQAQG